MINNHRALTQSQLSLWTGQKLNPEAPLYNMAHAFDIQGKIDTQIFQNAFSELLKRTDVLRTIFIEIDSIPYQSILESVVYELELLDFSSKDEATVQNWMKERSQHIFDLQKPLFDSALLKISNERYIWFLNIHHLVTDASTSVLLYKLQAKLYQQGLSKDEHQTDTSYSYNDFLNFESKQKESKLSATIQEYWKTKISNLTPSVKLYGNKNNASTTKSDRISVKLGLARSQKLRTLAQQPEIKSWTQDLTLFNIFATTLFAFMRRVSGEKRLAIGAPSHNRTTKGFKQTAGLFIEVFPIISEFENDDTFLSALNKVKLETNDYLRYAQTGMSTSEISRSFDVVLNYINAAFPDFNDIPMKSEWIHPDHCDANHQLRCHVYDMNASGDIEIYFDLNTDVFPANFAQEVPKHFLCLLDAFLTDTHVTIDKVALLSSEEIESKTSINKTIPQQSLVLETFKNTVENNSVKKAIHQKTTSFTYQELDEKSNQLASFLKKYGVKKGHKIGIHLHRSIEYMVSVLAILKTGAAFIPISSDQPRERIKFILSDADCTALLTSSELKHQLEENSTQVITLDENHSEIDTMSTSAIDVSIEKTDLAYILYTSGSTGNPKGVPISHHSLANYLSWAMSFYKNEEPFVFPLFTSIGFDLTITSTFLPLITGGELIVYKESSHGPDISLMEVLEDDKVNSIKLTPSHLALLSGNDYSYSRIKTMIVGGEDFKSALATGIQNSFGKGLRVFNEYGPTEATVGCIVSEFNNVKHANTSVPIGTPIKGVQAYIFDKHMNLVPDGVAGSLYIGGEGLAKGYLNLPELTSEKFIQNPFNSAENLYQTGDLARINSDGEYEYQGRIDEQIKLKGFRIELSDIEANLLKHESVENTAVVLIESEKAIPENEVINCADCGLPSNYPNTDFDKKGVCHVCNAFKGYKDQAQKYFKTEDELRSILISKRGQSPNYDCISLLSGGKDSTYILAQLINMGLKVLAFTLDNGYISDQAKGNINRIVSKLNVDHIYGTTEHMNKIFVDSLHRHQNVCNGCFKTIYTLATQIALEKQIPFVATGLSRGQFFETRLTEELFWDESADITKIDNTILEARKLYHQEEDAVKDLMDVSAFANDETFDKVQFIDFYRYTDVTLEEMLIFLKEKVDWVRPTDTGRSTNCTINQLGIYVHKKEKGYSNYSFPYSWDVRMGHKTRTETLEEINEVIDEAAVKQIMLEIGYTESNKNELEQKRLVGYYTGKQKLSSSELAKHLKKELPEHMVPTHFKFINELPLTTNGKVDKLALKALNDTQLEMETPFVAPEGEIEVLLAEIWKEVLQLKQVGVHDDFIILGGHSLAAIRVTARINEEIEMKFPLNKIFELPTISEYSKYVEETLVALLEE